MRESHLVVRDLPAVPSAVRRLVSEQPGMPGGAVLAAVSAGIWLPSTREPKLSCGRVWTAFRVSVKQLFLRPQFADRRVEVRPHTA